MKKQLGLLLGLLFWANIAAAAFPAFKVQDIKLEGIQHVKPGVVFHHFPINTGSVVTQGALSAAVKKLYQSGYFQNIEIEREGKVLILKLTERPAVSKIRIKGNKAIKTKPLLEGLEHSGLKEGIVFKRSSIERIKTELQSVYASQGRYNAKIEAQIEPLSGNRVAVNIDIKEGKIALITHINIVGNTLFDNEELTDLFDSKLASFWSWISKDDRYSRERLSGDVERLRSYYLDRGYLNFKVTSTQVSISPDKQNVFISINIFEGAKYKVGEISLKGELVVPESELRAALKIASGDTFSRQLLSDSQENMLQVLGNSGYMFAKIQPAPTASGDDTVDIQFFLQPGNQTYVRRINIKGNEKTADLVIRRQLKQMEAALASSEKITKSKEVLDRSGFFSNVNISTVPVAGSNDQIDVELTVEERASGSFTASVGFSQSEKLILDFGISQDNFLGSGNRVSASISKSDVKKQIRFDYTNPFYTVDGVSRGFDVYFQKEDFDDNSSSKYKVDELGLGVTFGYPINEYQRISVRLGVENIDVTANTDTSQEISNYIANNGNKFTNVNTTLYWSENRLNRGIFPTKGRKQNISLEISAPGSDLSYYRASYNGSWITPLSSNEQWLIGARGNVGYAQKIGDGDYPFFKNYFAGGIGSMRGVSANSLGPIDTQNDTIGGNVLITGGADLIFPMPGINDPLKYRTSLFVDIGGVFATQCLPVDSGTTSNCNEGVHLEDLKYSAGIGFTWLTPLGPLTFSYAKLLNKKSTDDEKKFDFTLGGTF
ncbi:MAG: outer membrane protein assembly factor BamA [Oceanospirillaceae bacterium]|nr:outer membrane protein assembly factor BamA [Oceanospirillaceae bacterium]